MPTLIIPDACQRLLKAANAVLGQVDNGELFCSTEPAVSNNCAALDELQDAVTEFSLLNTVNQQGSAQQ